MSGLKPTLLAPDRLPEVKDCDGWKVALVALDLTETGWLMASIWEKAKGGDHIARRLYQKIKGAAVAMGVEWYYGDPWPLDSDPRARNR